MNVPVDYVLAQPRSLVDQWITYSTAWGNFQNYLRRRGQPE